MTKPAPLIPLLAVAGATFVLVALLILTRPVPQPELRPTAATRIATTTVARHDFTPHERLTGVLQPARRTALHFEVAGRVAEKLVEAGARVEGGAILARLDDADYRDALAEAQARLTQEQEAVARDRKLLALAREHAVLQQQEAARLERLGEKSLASRTALGEARQRLLGLRADQARLEQSVATAEARIDLQRAARDRAARNLERSRLTAPFDGTVNRVELEVGDYLTPAQRAVELVETDRLDLYLEVNGAVAAALTIDREVAVEIDGERRAGRVVALQSAPDPATHTHPLRIRIDGAGLMPGRLARASLPRAALHGVPAVPVPALLRDEGRDYLFVEKDGRLERREVIPGPRLGEWQVILSGIEGGERIAARDVAALSDGQTVEAVMEESPAGAAETPAGPKD